MSAVAEALDSHDDEWSWWYDPATGEVDMGPGLAFLGDVDELWEDLIERGLVEIDARGSRLAYEDMAEFAESVREVRAAVLLDRALSGCGAFRRFRNTLHDFEGLVPHWLAFSRAGAEMRAIRWLCDEGFVTDDDADEQLAARRATQATVLAAIGRRNSLDVELSSLGDHRAEIEREVDAGHEVRVLRAGRPWATITPA